MKYIKEHWNGSLSLYTSFCINFILGTGLFILLFYFINLVLRIPLFESPRILARSIVLAYLFWLPLYIWQVVGVWRSASDHKRKTGNKFWANIVQCLLFLTLAKLCGDLLQPLETNKYKALLDIAFFMEGEDVKEW